MLKQVEVETIIDNIAIYGKRKSEHDEQLRKVPE